MSKKKNSISWEDFKAMGNPENAPIIQEEEDAFDPIGQRIRIHLEKKGRGGKEVSIVRGFDGPQKILSEIATALKKKCGVGGSMKDGEIIIQGNNRQKILKYLLDLGYKDVKLSGG